METRQIGRSGIRCSALGLGCWAIGGGTWWGDNDDQTSVDTILRAVAGHQLDRYRPCVWLRTQ